MVFFTPNRLLSGFSMLYLMNCGNQFYLLEHEIFALTKVGNTKF